MRWRHALCRSATTTVDELQLKLAWSSKCIMTEYQWVQYQTPQFFSAWTCRQQLLTHSEKVINAKYAALVINNRILCIESDAVQETFYYFFNSFETSRGDFGCLVFHFKFYFDAAMLPVLGIKSCKLLHIWTESIKLCCTVQLVLKLRLMLSFAKINVTFCFLDLLWQRIIKLFSKTVFGPLLLGLVYCSKPTRQMPRPLK